MEGPCDAQWAPDPYRRHELRYWDGVQWTEHVSEGDGAILLDPPLPSPRGRRRARTAAEDAASLADYVGGHPVRTLTPPSDRLSVEHRHADQRPVDPRLVDPRPVDRLSVERARSVVPQQARYVAAPLPYGAPAVAAPWPGSAPRRSEPAPARRSADLFAELPGVLPQRGSGGAPPAGFVSAQVDEGWDWRESRLPEALAALAVAALIGAAAFLGSGGFSDPAADVVDEVVPTSSAPPAATSTPTATKKTKKAKVPGVQLSSAPPGRVVRTSSSTARSSTSRTSSPRTSAPPTSTPPPSSSSSSEAPPSSSSSTSSSPSSSSSSSSKAGGSTPK